MPVVRAEGLIPSLCAQGVTEEVIHCLTHTDGIRVIARPSAPQSLAAADDIPSLSQKFGLGAVVEGTVRQEYHRLRINVRVLGSDGFQMSSHRFDTEASGEVLSQVQEQIASAFVSRARPEQSHVRRRKATPSALTYAVYPLVLHAETLLDEGSAADIPAALMKFQEAEVSEGSRRACRSLNIPKLLPRLTGSLPSHPFLLNHQHALSF